jgi:putative transposase
MLRSYTRAINKQENRSGSLFRNDTKAACLNSQSEYRKPFFTDNGITKINISHSEFQYPQNCFNYIHRNPIDAKLAKKASDYEFSSAKEYAGLRNNPIVNKKIAADFVDIEIRF